jgi:hypothetical protein
MSNKSEKLYNEIFIYIYKYITDNFDNTEIELKSYCTDFEDDLINGIFNTFKDNNLHIQYIGCFFHYLIANRKKLQKEHLTKKIYTEIYDKFMETFINYTFHDNISKNRIKERIIKN